MFGRKKEAPQKAALPVLYKKAPSWAGSGVDYVGFKYGDSSHAVREADKNKAYGISSKERTHMSIFGLPGSGKSTIIKLLVYQNIVRKQGFMVVDPHGELARDCLSMVPPEMHNDVIYINPASLYSTGKTIQINPLEVKSENERYVVVMSFVNTLYNLYKGSWGPRLETVLRNAANALVESKERNTLRDMSAMITDEDERAVILEDVASKNVKHFWEEIFAKQYSKDAGSSAYNKIDKILATPTVAAMFDSNRSSIDIREIMKNNRMLIVDLSTGASDDIAEFLGSIFLNMLYVEAKKRIDVEGADLSEMRKNPFYVYVDEAHMFSNSTMSEMLRALRKFGVKVTLATQTCNAYEKDFAAEIPGTCKTIITGRCDYNTANLLRSVMSVTVEDMQRLPGHTFAMHTDEQSVAANAVFRSRPVPLSGEPECDWQKLAKHSIMRWGKDVSIQKYIPREDSKIPFTPLEMLILHLMHFDHRDWYWPEILAAAISIFPSLKEKDVRGALDRLTREKYAKTMYPEHDDGDEHEGKKRFVIAERTYQTCLSKAGGGQRAGGDEHLEIIFRIADENRKKHRYCVPDLGDKTGDLPDLLVVEPGVITGKDGYETYSPFEWNEKNRLAVEVEMDPTKHIDHSVYNYTKNIDSDYDVWFVCVKNMHRERLEEEIRAKHPDFKKCKMDVIDHKRFLNGDIPIPKTYDEGFSGVAVTGIDELISKTDPETKNATHSRYIPQMKDAGPEMAKKREAIRAEKASIANPENIKDLDVESDTPENIENPDVKPASSEIVKEGTFNAATAYSRESDKTEFPNLVKEEEPEPEASDAADVGIRLDDLDYRILQIIKRDSGFEASSKKILRRLKLEVSESEINTSIGKLIMSGMVITSYVIFSKSIEMLDGSGRRKSHKKVKVLSLAKKEGNEESDEINFSNTSDEELAVMLSDPSLTSDHEAIKKEMGLRGNQPL